MEKLSHYPSPLRKTPRISWSLRRLLAFGALMLGFFGTTSAQATSTANSSAFGESVNVTLLPIVGGGIPVQSGPLPTVSGSAPPPFAKTATVASATLQVPLPLVGQLFLATDVLTVNASADVPNVNNASADATVNSTGLTLGLLGALLSVDAEIIQSTADISGACGALKATGTTTIVGGAIGGLVAKSILLNPAPNTVLLNQLGIKVVANEQIPTGDANNRALTVNAIHISFTNTSLLGIGVLSGDIILSQSKAALKCAPPAADLVLTKTGSPDLVIVGDLLTYTVKATNQGPDAATNVVMTDTLPLGATFVSATPSQGTCTGTSTVTCKLATINKGANATVTIKVQITKVINKATVKADQADPNKGNNSASATTALQ